MLKFVCVLLFAATVSAGNIKLRPCGGAENSIGSDITLDVPQFPDGTSSVELKKGTKYDFKISFTSASASETLTNKLFGVISGIEVPWQGVEPNACENISGNRCPLVAGGKYVYENDVTVDPSYPSVSVTILWKLVDENSKNQVCFKLPAKIVA